MFKLIEVIRALRDRIAAKDWKAVPGVVADVLDALSKSDEANAVRGIITGITDENAHDIAVDSARLVFDVLEGYYGFAHVTVKALPASDGDDVLLQRATALCDHMDGHAVSKVTGQARVTALSPEVWTVIANVLSSLILNFFRNRGV